MTVIDTLITDRATEDYETWLQLKDIPWADMTAAQKTTWLTGAATKGSYGASDLNRVGEAITYLAQRLAYIGFPVSVSPKTDFVEGNNKYSTYTQIVNYLNDLQTLRSIMPLPATTPQIPTTADDWTIEDANNIERMLVVLEEYITRFIDAWIYCGDVYSGEF